MLLYDLFVDGHVHIYPTFDLARAITYGLQNMNRLLEARKNDLGTERIWLLTERNHCNFFRQTYDSAVQLSNKQLSIERGADGESLLVRKSGIDEPVLFILPGRQIVSSDDLEVCALVTATIIPNRAHDTAETIKRALDCGGVPALNWAPGKWFFSRGKIVRKLLEKGAGGPLLIGDTSMRPTFWPMPHLMQKAKEEGHKIIAGSDPLPFPGEEDNIGSYGFKMKGKFDPAKPAASVRALLLDANTEIELCGRRSGPFSFAKRQSKIMTEKKNRS